ncbi:MAG TPA: CDP-alcohol phosphatidyltransferase family protein [Polyangia bacterium]|nr:CDP-alcohol phosphatidyltransferase family protein [Polyangia bacterium]
MSASEAPRAFWRYLPPNAVTASSLVFGVIAVEVAIAGRPIEATWWGLICLFTDKLDGFLAGALKAGSTFGMQLDSLADLSSFGVVPATILFAFFSTRPQLGWATGGGLLALRVLCCAWVIAVGVRLARFNVAAARGPHQHYTGTPSTMTAGLVLTLFLTCLKYADPRWSAPETHDSWRWLGPLRTDALVRWVPLAMVAGAAGMLSPLRVPRLGRTRHRATDALLLAAVLFGYGVGLARRLPEYLFLGGMLYVVLCVAYHLRTRHA